MLAARLVAALLFLASPLAWPANAGAAGRASTSTATVDLNHASVGELVTLPGIGPRRAETIVEERRRRPFRSVKDLLRIPGIGPKTLAKLRPRLAVTPPRGAPARTDSPGGAATRRAALARAPPCPN